MALLVTAILPSVTGLAKDEAANTFALGGNTAGITSGDLDEISAAIVSFYNDLAAGQTTPLSTYLAADRSRGVNASEVKIYDIAGHLDGSPHGSPIREDTFTLGAASGTFDDNPSEVAFKVTLEAQGRSEALVETPDGIDAGTKVDRPRARRTGGLFIGPLALSANTEISGVTRPLASFAENVRDATIGLDTAIKAVGSTNNFFLGVWSRVDAVVRGLEAVSTDDAFDTQRRRGAQPTARTRVAIV